MEDYISEKDIKIGKKMCQLKKVNKLITVKSGKKTIFSGQGKAFQKWLKGSR